MATCSPTKDVLSEDDQLSKSGILNVFGTLCDNSIDPSELESVRICLESSLLNSKYRCNSQTCNSVVVKPPGNQTSDDYDINSQSHTTMVCTSEEHELPTKHDDLVSSENISLNNIHS